jgi:hypothetical protein
LKSRCDSSRFRKRGLSSAVPAATTAHPLVFARGRGLRAWV